MPSHENFVSSFKRRLAGVKTTRWIRFAVASLLFFALVIWIGNPWLLIIWLLMIDIYLTNFINWSWWKNSKNKSVRIIMSWVDAIVYALVMVYLIFAFIGQNYKIPSSSLEKTLLVGDYLLVDKTAYGPRVPMTPLHFPLSQHTLPLLNTKSYIENPQIPYHRMPGRRNVKRGDIVVFNYPQGDTVATRMEQPDYYAICAELRKRGITDPKTYIESNKMQFGELVYRPVDRRENYVKRAIGLPGDRLSIRRDTVRINGKPLVEPKYVQHNYLIPVSAPISDNQWMEIGVRYEDRGNAPMQSEDGVLFYNVPLTSEMKALVEKMPQVTAPLVRETEAGVYDLTGVFPTDASTNWGWTRADMGEIWIPKRGVTLHLTPQNIPIYARAISTYEGNDLRIDGNKIFINGKETDHYTFKMDYYWMMGDNRDRSLDSRYWGFVPEDHIIGTPLRVLISFDEERSLIDGKIRFDRIFRNPNPDAD